MGNLSNLYISQSFQSLIHLGTNNTASATLIGLEDGYGNPIGVAVNTAGDLSLSGSFTASLQNGYTYVGNSVGKSIAVATSSFASTLDTGSFAITGSNTFRGVQFISGSLTSYSGSNPGPNVFPTAIVVSGSIMPSMPNSFDLGNDDFKFNSVTVQGAIKGSSLNINARCNLGTVILGDESFPLSFLSPRELVADGTGVDTHLYYGTSSANPQGLREIAYIQSGSNANLAAYATTGSNYFVGSQTISGSITIVSGSGDLYVHGHKQFNCGGFQSNVTQSGSASISQSVQFDTTDLSYGVTLSNGSRLNIANAGVYSITFSAQILADTGADTIYIWLKKNGTNVPESATKLALRNNEEAVMTVNFLVEAANNDYYELAWQNEGGDAVLYHAAAVANVPLIPSVIITLVQVR